MDLIHHQHCQWICQKSLNLPTLFLLLYLEPIPGPNIELRKCNSEASKKVARVEDMTTVYSTILVIDGPNFLEVLLVFSSGESL